MGLIQVVVFLLLCSVVLGWLSRRAGVPYPIALVLGGGVLSFIPGLPQLDIDPQFLLVLVLPPILYQAALLTSWRDFKANLRSIGLLAIGLVIATTLAVGAMLKLLMPDIPWAVAFVFGAIVSPPDAVAATAILSRLNMPRRIVVVLEGESMVNDASGLVLYKLAVAAVLTGTFSFFGASVAFVTVSAGGIAIGIVLGLAFVGLHRLIGDAFTEVLVSLSIPYTVYVVAEALHCSGVLAVVVAGLVRGRFTPAIVSAEMRILARSVWNILVFMMNSLIFMLIGMALSGVMGRLASYRATDLAIDAVSVTLVAIAVRFAWVYPATYVPRWLSARLRAAEAAPQRGETFIMSWCGMRGIVSLAAALALPVHVQSGELFPYRDLIIFFTFVAISVTLVVQGLTLTPLIRRLKLGSDPSVYEEHMRARVALGKAALSAIDAVAANAKMPGDLVSRVRAEFSDRIGAAMPHGHDGAFGLGRSLRLTAVRAERQELIRIWRAGEISDDILHHFEEELDYEEQRF
ncbi:MAG TPA: Na+/H+ antiporter [Burkholderiales bacterium]|nr:Na+/H+ antiporter [Burkholderiales bacterium]